MSTSPTPPRNEWGFSTTPASPVTAPPPPDRSGKVVRAIFGGLAAIFVVLITVYIVSLNIKPSIATPKRPAAPSTNGFPMLKVATEKPIREKEIGEAIKIANRKKWPLAKRKGLITENRVPIAETREALRHPYYEENKTTSLRDQFPYYKKFRHMTRVLVVAGDVAWEEGKQKEAVDYYLDGITIGRRVPRRTVLIASLVGVACETVGRRPLWNNLNKLDVATTTHTLARLEALLPERLPYWETLEEEKYSMLHIAEEIMEHPERYNEEEKDTDDGVKVIRVYSKFVPRKHVVDTMSAHMDKVIAQSKKPYITDSAELPLPSEILTRIMVPVLAQARAKYVVNETADAMLRTCLALRVYRQKNGKYPDKLSDLVAAKLLSQVPNDPFALPNTPLQYKPAKGDKYLLYSIGPDGVDDNGKGIVAKGSKGAPERTVRVESKGDMVAGWYGY